MTRLLSANIMRLKKDTLFWIGFVFMLAEGIWFPLRAYWDAAQTNSIRNLDDSFFAGALFINIIMAIFCSMFVGTEYSDGTIRNKIIVGQKRTGIYLANVITASLASVILYMAFALPYLGLGIPLLGFFAADIQLILLTGLTVLILGAAFASVFTLIAMLCQNKATSVVCCMLLALGFFMAGITLNQMLEAPKMISSYTMSEDGNFGLAEELNPKYLEGTQREIIQTLYDIIPGGQAIQCSNLTAVNLPRLPFYSLGIILLTSGMGFVLFQKKDLK